MNWNAIRTYILGSGILMVVVPYAINFFTNAIGCMGDNPATEVLELTVCTGGSLLAIPGWMQTTVAVVVLSALGAVKLFTGTGSHWLYLQPLARRAGARYLVDGELQSGKARRVLSLRLTDTVGGSLAWSDRFELPDIADSVDALVATRKVIRRLAAAVATAETRRVLAMPLSELDAMELVVRAWAVLDGKESVAAATEARKLLDDATRLDPTLVPALTTIGAQLDQLNDIDPKADHERYVRESDEISARAVTLDPHDPSAWYWRAMALNVLGHWNSSLEASDRWIKLDPYSSFPYSQRAWLMNKMGQPGDALSYAQKAQVLSPGDGWALRVECESHLLLGEHDKAIASCERAIGTLVDYIPHTLLAAAYANAGDTVRAQATLEGMLRIVPGFTITQARAKRYSDHPEYQKLAEQYWYGGLRKAGLAEK